MQKNIWIAAKYLSLSIEDGDKAESESIVTVSYTHLTLPTKLEV